MRGFLGILASILLILNSGCRKKADGHETQSAKASHEINALIEAKSFFEAKRKFKQNKALLGKMDSVHFAAQLSSLFNNLEVSNQLVQRLYLEFEHKMTDSLQKELLGLQFVNYAKLHQYKKAYTIGEKLINDYNDLLEPEEAKNYRNTNAIWEALQDIPPQAAIIEDSTSFKMIRDKANLRNLPVRSNGETIDFIFDTGANISTVVASTSDTMGMRQIAASIQVSSITGEKVEASLAVSDTLALGNMTFTNVVFLVFPDEALSVPSIEYQIKGILGYPVIEAMKQVTITKNDEFRVPLIPVSKQQSNLALDFLTPIIEIEDEHGERLPYAFDTGATTSMLYPAYFTKHQDEIESKYKKLEFEFGGAGGSIKKEGYRVDFRPKINNELILLDSVELIATDTTSTFQHYYGNLGQDLIHKFDALTLNFESMYIAFENF